MDREFKELEQALRLDPQNQALRARYYRGAARAGDPRIANGLTMLMAFLDGLAVISQSSPSLIETSDALGLLNSALAQETDRLGADAVGIELLRLQLSQREAVSSASILPQTEARRPPMSLWQLMPRSLPALLSLALTRPDLPLALTLASDIFAELADLLSHGFEGRYQGWTFRIGISGELREYLSRAEPMAVPRLFPLVLENGQIQWPSSVSKDGPDGPMSPFLRALFRRLLGPHWVLRSESSDRGSDTRRRLQLFSEETQLVFESRFD